MNGLHFREGEIIPLALSFTSTADKRYWASNRNYDRSGRLNIETYCVEPAARDPLADYFRTGAFMGGGLGSEQQLSEKPFTATAELNEWRQPGPGHYRLYVVSHRGWRPAAPNEPTPYGRVGVTLRSNMIEFDVIEADAAWRAEQLRDATTAYQSAAAANEQKEAARRLRFLNTQLSTEALVRLFWGLNDHPGGWELMFGLFGSPYRAEVIATMQHEINSPSHAITQDFLRPPGRSCSLASPFIRSGSAPTSRTIPGTSSSPRVSVSPPDRLRRLAQNDQSHPHLQVPVWYPDQLFRRGYFYVARFAQNKAGQPFDRLAQHYVGMS